jgi:O-Antigen ligase
MNLEALVPPRPVTTTRSWSTWSAAALLLPLVAIAGVGAASGGFFATSFGWTALAFSWATVAALSLVAPRWRRLDAAWLTAAAGVSLVTFLSALWAGSPGDAFDEGFRSLVYLTGVAGALVVLRRRDLSRWLAGLVLGATGVCAYGLATRILPTHFSGFDSGDYRLFEPVGYWNALGIFASLALLLALGVAALGRGAVLRVLAATCAVVLAPTLLFTYSRGAWVALAAGTIVMFLLSPARTRLLAALLVLGAVPAATVLLASRAPGLTQRGATLAAASHDGHRLLLELAAVATAQVAVATAFVLVLSRLAVPRLLHRAFAALALVAVAASLAVVFDRYGSPVTIARHGYNSFSSPPALTSNLNSRLFSLSNNGRIVLWHAAWHDFTDHPVGGSGAGSFERYWLAHRSSTYYVQDAHELYLETLASSAPSGSRCSSRSSRCRSSPRCGPAPTRWSRRRSAATSPSSSTPASTGTGRCRR